MQQYKIILVTNKCIGCGACTFANEKYYQMRDDGKSHLIGSKEDKNSQNQILENITNDYEENMDAAQSCPVNCIHIYKIIKNNQEEKEEKII
jgi:ferredoxin